MKTTHVVSTIRISGRIIAPALLLALGAGRTEGAITGMRITQAGATWPQAAILASKLGIDTNLMSLGNGVLSFVHTNYLAIPTVPCTDPVTISNLLAVTVNEYPAIPIAFRQIDFATLTNLPVFNTNTAIATLSNALAAASLGPGALLANRLIAGTPTAGYDLFSVVYTNGADVIAVDQIIGTHVQYSFSDTNGTRCLGPAMHVQAAFDSYGNATRLFYSACSLSNGPPVALITSNTAISRAAALLPTNGPGGFSAELVYYAPLGGSDPPSLVLPHWLVTYTNDDPSNANFTALGVVLPATEDAILVPSASLMASAPNDTQVVATVTVSGGTPPYSYTWAGSDPTVSTNTGSSLTYTPSVRIAPPALQVTPMAPTAVAVSWTDPSVPWIVQSTASLSAPWGTNAALVQQSNSVSTVTFNVHSNLTQFFRLALPGPTLTTTESVAVIVTDANGITVTAIQNIGAQGNPAWPAPGGIRTYPTYGCECPAEADSPLWVQFRSGWEYGMSAPLAGGGAEVFSLVGNNAWPGDFIRPNPPGVLPPLLPAIYGDADCGSRGIDTANLVLFVGGGTQDALISRLPNAPQGTTGDAWLWRPGNAAGTVEVSPSINPYYYRVAYNGSWGPIGPNDSLDWLCCVALGMLAESDSAQLDPAGRWLPAMDGLHILCGTSSLLSPVLPQNLLFGPMFARGLLGKPNFPPLPIHAAWADALLTTFGEPVELGTTSFGGVVDYGDYYWGKGPVGPNIPASQINGYWMLHGQ